MFVIFDNGPSRRVFHPRCVLQPLTLSDAFGRTARQPTELHVGDDVCIIVRLLLFHLLTILHHRHRSLLALFSRLVSRRLCIFGWRRCRFVFISTTGLLLPLLLLLLLLALRLMVTNVLDSVPCIDASRARAVRRCTSVPGELTGVREKRSLGGDGVAGKSAGYGGVFILENRDSQG